MARNKLLTIRTTAEELEALDLCARQRGLSVAAWVRNILGLGDGVIRDSARTMITDNAAAEERNFLVMADGKRVELKSNLWQVVGGINRVHDAAAETEDGDAAFWVKKIADVYSSMMNSKHPQMVELRKTNRDSRAGNPSGPASSSGQNRPPQEPQGTMSMGQREPTAKEQGTNIGDAAPQTLEGLLPQSKRGGRAKPVLDGLLKGRVTDSDITATFPSSSKKPTLDGLLADVVTKGRKK